MFSASFPKYTQGFLSIDLIRKNSTLNVIYIIVTCLRLQHHNYMRLQLHTGRGSEMSIHSGKNLNFSGFSEVKRTFFVNLSKKFKNCYFFKVSNTYSSIVLFFENVSTCKIFFLTNYQKFHVFWLISKTKSFVETYSFIVSSA